MPSLKVTAIEAAIKRKEAAKLWDGEGLYLLIPPHQERIDRPTSAPGKGKRRAAAYWRQ